MSGSPRRSRFEPGTSWLHHLLATFGSDAEAVTWRDRGPGEGISDGDWYLVDSLPFERIDVPGHMALAEWRRLRREQADYPVIVGTDENLIRVAEQWVREGPTVAEILAAADGLDYPDCLAEWTLPWAEEKWEPPLGEWPEEPEVARDGPSILVDPLTGTTIETAYILLIPARSGFEVPAHFRFGAWNNCPPPELHVAALRGWHDRYGAELVAIGGDVVDLWTRTRPLLSPDCITLAREHFQYCSDVLDLGHGDLAGLAAELKHSSWWSFWWD